ncbi:hypothetical protein [Streptomyces griseus]|uniref:hypothetical protein n=1 Tax=Streptomyces griseus TaxID=1911 RepID=UPI0033DCA7A4
MPRLAAEVTGTVVLAALASLTAEPEAAPESAPDAVPEAAPETDPLDGVVDRVEVADDTVEVRWAEDGARTRITFGGAAVPAVSAVPVVTVVHGRPDTL